MLQRSSRQTADLSFYFHFNKKDFGLYNGSLFHDYIFMKMFTTCIQSTGSQQMNNYL